MFQLIRVRRTTMNFASKVRCTGMSGRGQVTRLLLLVKSLVDAIVRTYCHGFYFYIQHWELEGHSESSDLRQRCVIFFRSVRQMAAPTNAVSISTVVPYLATVKNPSILSRIQMLTGSPPKCNHL